MKISYAILTHNEGEEIDKLLNFLIENKRKEDEIVIVDDNSTDDKTIEVLEKFKSNIVEMLLKRTF
jgi:GT2 family glycosyltransferase